MKLQADTLRERMAPLFQENFERLGELGAAVSIWQNGEPTMNNDIQLSIDAFRRSGRNSGKAARTISPLRSWFLIPLAYARSIKMPGSLIIPL